MNEWDLTRQEFLRRSLAAGAVVLGAGGLAACGGGGGSSAPATAPTNTARTRGGVFKVGVGGGSPSDTLDPHTAVTQVDIARQTQLYDTPFRQTVNATIENRLVEEATPTRHGQVWTLRLRDGIEFHNGQPLTADDLIYSLRRTSNPKLGGFGATLLDFIDPQQIQKLDKLTARFTLKRPVAPLPEFLAVPGYTNIVPADFNPKKPVGTGPFQLNSFSPGVQSTFDRFPNYWDGPALVDQVVMTNLSDDAARVNALLAGQVDAIDSAPASQVRVLEARSELAVMSTESGITLEIGMLGTAAPFSDVRVRQAFMLAADRSQIVEQALDGQGTLGNDYPSPIDPCSSTSLTQREPDIEQAKSLLRQAGHESMNIELVTTPYSFGMVEMAQVFAQQLKAVGVNVKVNKRDITSFFNSYGKWPFYTTVDAPYSSYLPIVSFGRLPGGFAGWNDKEFAGLFNDALRELDGGRRCSIIAEMQRMEHERGVYVIPVRPNGVYAYKRSISGLVPDKTGLFSGYQYRKVSVA